MYFFIAALAHESSHAPYDMTFAWKIGWDIRKQPAGSSLQYATAFYYERCGLRQHRALRGNLDVDLLRALAYIAEVRDSAAPKVAWRPGNRQAIFIARR